MGTGLVLRLDMWALMRLEGAYFGLVVSSAFNQHFDFNSRNLAYNNLTELPEGLFANAIGLREM